MAEADRIAVETFNQINYFCIAIFTIEIILRLVSTPNVSKNANCGTMKNRTFVQKSKICPR